MGYVSEVSIIVGKRVNRKIKRLVSKITKEVAEGKSNKVSLENLNWFLSNRTVSADKQYIRYSNDYVKWYTDCDEPEYDGLARLENLVKKEASKYENLKDGDAASFIRIGEGSENREYVDNWGGLQHIGVVLQKEFK